MTAFPVEITLNTPMTDQGNGAAYKRWVPLLILSVLIPFLYWRVLPEPFVQDDWFVLDIFRWNSVSDIIQGAFSPVGKLLYRPMGTMYMLGMYLLFGLATIPFHVIAIILQIANSFLVIQIFRQITRNDLLSIVTGVVYGVAASVHIELLFWIVGFYDLGELFFFLSAFLLFMNRHLVLSVAAFLVAIFIKESTVGLIGVFIGYSIFIEKRPLRQLLPYIIICAVYLVLKVIGVSPFTLDPEHPYKAQLIGGHVLHNLSLYADWGLEALFPFHRWLPRYVEGIIIIAFAMLLLRKLWTLRSAGFPMPTVAFFLVTWIVSGIILIVFLPNHGAKYYIVTSLAPFLALSLLVIDFVLPVSFRKAAWPVSILFVALVAASHWLVLEQQFADRSDRVRVNNGTDNLFQKAQVVRSVHDKLTTQYPRLEDSTTIIVDDVDIGPLGDSVAVRLWYDNRTIDIMNQQKYDARTAADQQYGSRPVVVLSMSPRSE